MVRSGVVIGELTAAVMLRVHIIGVLKLTPRAARPGDIDERVYATKRESWSGNLSFRMLIPESPVPPGKSRDRL